jgi:hypothetical protein
MRPIARLKQVSVCAAVRQGKSFFKWFVSAVVILLLFYCQSPIQPPDTSSDYIEFESVWQYLKAFSIYQDRIPPDPFVYKTPTDLLNAISDTVKTIKVGLNTYNYYYTTYETKQEQIAAAISKTAALTAGAGAVFLDSLTTNTALLTIWTFDSISVFSEFVGIATQIPAQFPNIVINLRNNGGGYIDQADSVLMALVPAGTHYIQARQRDYDTVTKKYVTVDWHDWVTEAGPLLSGFGGKKYAVLMNGWTASASELFIAGLWEGTNAQGGKTWLIGSRTFGKGIGQVEILRRRDITVVSSGQIQERLLKITFLQLRGIHPRIGDYRWQGVLGPGDTVGGILPDTVPQAIKQQGDTLLADTSFQRQIFYAVKMLDSTTPPQSINYPPERSGLNKMAVPRCSKIVSEDQIKLPAPVQ